MLNLFLIFSIFNFKFVDVEKAVNKNYIDTSYLDSINFRINDLLYFDLKLYKRLCKEHPVYFNEFINSNKICKKNLILKEYKRKKEELLNKYNSINELLNDYKRDYDLFELVNKKKEIINEWINYEDINKTIYFYKNKYMFETNGDYSGSSFIIEFDNKTNKIYYYFIYSYIE